MKARLKWITPAHLFWYYGDAAGSHRCERLTSLFTFFSKPFSYTFDVNMHFSPRNILRLLTYNQLPLPYKYHLSVKRSHPQT